MSKKQRYYGQNAAIVEKVGTTYALLESIQTKISICYRLHRWHYERETTILYQTRQNAVIVEKVRNYLRTTRFNANIKSMCCRLHWWHHNILYQTRQDTVIVKKVGTPYPLLDLIQTKNIDMLSYTSMSVRERNKDIKSDQAICSNC